MDAKFVSVIIPIYNEEKNLEHCIESMLLQDYPENRTEWLFVDGMSRDRTRAILTSYCNQYPGRIFLFSNPKRTIPCAMNIGIREAKGDYIIRMDAHAEYGKNYISKCIEILEKTGADNVGGAMDTRAEGRAGEVIARMLSSRFGVGGSGFRTKGKDGYTDTVPFGTFRRDLFERIGGYDERLLRNEDNELNHRILKNGGTIYLSNEIKLTYYCRETVPTILKMALMNGMWNIITEKQFPGSMRLRHFIPLAFVLSLLILPWLTLLSKVFFLLLLFELAVYLLLDVFFSLKDGRRMGDAFFLFFLFPAFHITYGVGSLLGIGRVFCSFFFGK